MGIWNSKKAFIHEDEREIHYEKHLEWLKKHQGANEIVYSKNSHFPVAAIYLSPEGQQEKHVKSLFKTVKRDFFERGLDE